MFEELSVFYRGLLLGLLISVPVGPIGLLCIRRTIRRGLIIGLLTGFGAAMADTILGGIAAFSVSAIIDFLQHYSAALRILGGLFLLIVAWHTWYDTPEEPAKAKCESGINPADDDKGRIAHGIGAVVSSFGITLTNPLAMFATLAVVATLSDMRDSTDAVTLVGGIFSGSAMWWAILCGVVALVRTYFTESRVLMINRITALALAALAIYAAITGAMKLLGHPIH